MKALYLATDCVERDENQKMFQEMAHLSILKRMLEHSPGYEQFAEEHGEWELTVAYDHDNGFREAFSGPGDNDMVFVSTCFFKDGDNEQIENIMTGLRESVPVFLLEIKALYPLDLRERRIVTQRMADGYVADSLYDELVVDMGLSGDRRRFYEGLESYLSMRGIRDE